MSAKPKESTDSGADLARWEYQHEISTGGWHGIILMLGAAFLCIATVPLAFASFEWTWQHSPDAWARWMLPGIALFIVFGFAAGVRQYLWPKRHSAFISEGALTWRARQQTATVMLCDVSRVNVTFGRDFPQVTLISRGNTAISIPYGCVGDAETFCEAVFRLSPTIKIHYGRSPGCEVCGRRAGAVRAKEESFQVAIPERLCRTHRRLN